MHIADDHGAGRHEDVVRELRCEFTERQNQRVTHEVASLNGTVENRLRARQQPSASAMRPRRIVAVRMTKRDIGQGDKVAAHTEGDLPSSFLEQSGPAFEMEEIRFKRS